MNVMILNQQAEQLSNVDFDIIKSINGIYTSTEIVEIFKNFFYDKMIIDVTSIKDFDKIESYSGFKNNIDFDKIIFYLPQGSSVCTPSFLAQFVKLGVYNFTTNIDGIKFLIKRSNTFENVSSLLQYSNTGAVSTTSINTNTNVNNSQVVGSLTSNIVKKEIKNETPSNDNNVSRVNELKIIGFINATVHAGSTSLVYMLRNELKKVYGDGVVAIEVNRHDFQYYNDKSLLSVTSDNLLSTIKKNENKNVILIDFNDYRNENICNDVIYLLEPSIIKLNRLVRNRVEILKKMKNKKVVLNMSLLEDEDIKELSSEAGFDVFYSIPPLNDREKNTELIEFCNKLGLVSSSNNTNSQSVNGIFSIFRR